MLYNTIAKLFDRIKNQAGKIFNTPTLKMENFTKYNGNQES